MNNTDLPALPPAGASGPGVCDIIRLYLAVSHDLNPYQIRAISGHLRTCPDCVRQQYSVSRTTNMIANLETSEPSHRVDQAVMAAIAERTGSRLSNTSALMRSTTPYKKRSFRSPIGLVSAAAAIAAILVVAIMSVVQFALSGPTAFAVPASISWSNYVLYHSQLVVDDHGESYRIESYHDMATNHMNVETTVSGKLDVMAISDGHKILGMDMMNHKAQWHADAWTSNDAIFDLTQLRKDLQTGHATYLGKDRFQGQDVYRIRDDTGGVLLLDTHYRPVNVLQGATTPGTGKPIYDKLQLLMPTQVPSSMWDQSIPTDFKIGNLPAKP